MTEPDFLHLADGRRLATRVREGSGRATLLFLPGYASDMAGAKALALDGWAAECGLGLVRFDYGGTGASPGRFEDGTLDGWLADALAVADRLTDGPLIPVGSSMGGWLALLLALRRPNRVRGLLGIAAAPDFTDWGYGDADRRTLVETGRLERPNPYGGEAELTTRGFWESGQRLLLGTDIPLHCPVRLVHGDADGEVPLEVALRTKDALASADVQLWVVKGGGHRLSSPHEIRTILRAAADLIELAG
ncbi:alpha/beta hydrolase [Sphingomonas sp. BN140010]|uniref:Alpha/beta hydrolase n=1 Tax=Sphingomonas arvum TaxID=2992113 RepID=A0ABT3JGE8_9SPHN|nr:alpha/beta hydrolase [Sphingomonas sp. BN140010]MCW3797861.1 alpha/beta hydrolase [Sphingomonas sp. BN140010]